MNKIHYTSGHFYIEKDGKKIKIANPELLYPLTIYGEMQFVDLPKELSVEIKDACDSDCCTMDGACGSNCRSPLKVAILSKSSSPEIPDSSWIDFDKSKGSNQKLPPVKKYVACQKKSLNDRFPDPIVIGYLKYAAGDVECPNFITPGAIGHGEVYRWCDCIADDFEWPSPPTVGGTSTELKSDSVISNNSENDKFHEMIGDIVDSCIDDELTIYDLRKIVNYADALFNCIKQNQDVIPSWMKEAYENYAKGKR